MAKRRLTSALEAGKILGATQITNVRRTVIPNSHGVFSIQFSLDGSGILSATGKGTIEVHSTKDMKHVLTMKRDYKSNLPITSFQINPKNGNLVLSVGSDGYVCLWDLNLCECVHSFCEENNVINTVNFNSTGEIYATGGKDTDIRIYDSRTHDQFLTCYGKDASDEILSSSPEVGHGRRVFSVKFHPENSNILISGGWDKFLKIWDIRSGRAVRTIHGPYICGEGIDIIGNYILTASWVPTKSLQTYDFMSGERIDTIPFSSIGELTAEYLYCAKYLTKHSIIAGGSGTCDVRLVHMQTGELLGNIENDRRPIQAIDIMEDNIAIGGVGQSITIATIEAASS